MVEPSRRFGVAGARRPGSRREDAPAAERSGVVGEGKGLRYAETGATRPSYTEPIKRGMGLGALA